MLFLQGLNVINNGNLYLSKSQKSMPLSQETLSLIDGLSSEEKGAMQVYIDIAQKNKNRRSKQFSQALISALNDIYEI